MNLQNRIPPPLVLLATGLAMWPVATLSPVLPGHMFRTVLAAALIAAGMVVTLLGVARFRAAGTTIDPTRPDRAAKLVVDGIYRFTRTPCTWASQRSCWLGPSSSVRSGRWPAR